MKAACYVGDKTMTVVEGETTLAGRGRNQARCRVHGDLRYGPAHPARRDRLPRNAHTGTAVANFHDEQDTPCSALTPRSGRSMTRPLSQRGLTAARILGGICGLTGANTPMYSDRCPSPRGGIFQDPKSARSG